MKQATVRVVTVSVSQTIANHGTVYCEHRQAD